MLRSIRYRIADQCSKKLSLCFEERKKKINLSSDEFNSTRIIVQQIWICQDRSAVTATRSIFDRFSLDIPFKV